MTDRFLKEWLQMGAGGGRTAHVHVGTSGRVIIRLEWQPAAASPLGLWKEGEIGFATGSGDSIQSAFLSAIENVKRHMETRSPEERMTEENRDSDRSIETMREACRNVAAAVADFREELRRGGDLETSLVALDEIHACLEQIASP